MNTGSFYLIYQHLVYCGDYVNLKEISTRWRLRDTSGRGPPVLQIGFELGLFSAAQMVFHSDKILN